MNSENVLLIIALSLGTIDIVPPVTCKFLLIEDGAIGAQERSALFSFTAIVANMISLTTRLDVGVHARSGRYIAAMEIRMRHLVQNWIVNTGCARDFAEILAFRFASSLWLHVVLLQRLLVVVLGAVVLKFLQKLL